MSVADPAVLPVQIWCGYLLWRWISLDDATDVLQCAGTEMMLIWCAPCGAGEKLMLFVAALELILQDYKCFFSREMPLRWRSLFRGGLQQQWAGCDIRVQGCQGGNIPSFHWGDFKIRKTDLWIRLVLDLWRILFSILPCKRLWVQSP